MTGHRRDVKHKERFAGKGPFKGGQGQTTSNKRLKPTSAQVKFRASSSRVATLARTSLLLLLPLTANYQDA